MEETRGLLRTLAQFARYPTDTTSTVYRWRDHDDEASAALHPASRLRSVAPSSGVRIMSSRLPLARGLAFGRAVLQLRLQLHDLGVEAVALLLQDGLLGLEVVDRLLRPDVLMVDANQR